MGAPFDAGITTRSPSRARSRTRRDATIVRGLVSFATLGARSARLGAFLATAALATAAVGCGGSVPRPPLAPVAAADYVQVAAAPGPARVEELPPSPRKGAVWVDGQWSFTGAGYRWEPGAWVMVPPGARFAPAVVVRREKDDVLFFARASWKGEDGRTVDPPEALARPMRKSSARSAEPVEGGKPR